MYFIILFCINFVFSFHCFLFPRHFTVQNIRISLRFLLVLHIHFNPNSAGISCFFLMCCPSLRHSSFLFFCSFPSVPCLSALYLSALYLSVFLSFCSFPSVLCLSALYLFVLCPFAPCLSALYSFVPSPLCPLPFFCSLVFFYLLYCYLLIKFIFIIYLIFLLITINPALTFLSCHICLSVRFFRTMLIVCWNDSCFMVR